MKDDFFSEQVRKTGDMVKRDVHLFACRGMKLVYDVNSGSLHQVDEPAADAIELLLQGCAFPEVIASLAERFSRETVQEVLGEIQSLKEKNLLFSAPLTRHDPGGSAYPLKALCLLLSQDCNLSCRYCFVRDENTRNALQMPLEVGLRAVDLLLESESGRHREIDFFGGEPLLNFPVFKETVAYAKKEAGTRGIELTFTLTTNALLCTEEIVEFLNREGISVVLSLDGRPAVHDAMRQDRRGRGSYRSALQNIRRLLEGRDYRNYYIRGTITKHNLDFSRDVEHLLDQGFDSLSLEPVVASPGEDYALEAGDLPQMEQEYERLLDLFLNHKAAGKPFLFYHFLVDLGRGPCLYKRLSGCGAGREYLAVAADGSLYPCHQFSGRDKYYMGSIMDEKPLQENPCVETLYEAARIQLECAGCWARYLCGFGCAAAVLTQTGGMESNDFLSCALQKMRLEKALYLQAAQP